MKVVILAAGQGVRLHPLTETQPKVMLPLANRPVLEHIMVEAIRAGFRDFVFVVGYRSHAIEAYFQDGARWSAHIEYVTQPQQLGTAHALSTLAGMVADRFLVINGDSLVKAPDIGRVAASDRIALGVIEHRDPRHLGVVSIEGGRIVRIHEKMENPPSNLANAGLYLFTPDIFSALARTRKSPRGEYELTASLQLLIDEGQVVSHTHLEYWKDLTYPWDLLDANESIMANIETQDQGVIEDGATLKGAVSIGESTLVRAGAYITGPVIIGANCDIGPNCFIRPSTAIGDGCRIGQAVELENSIVMNGCEIPRLSYAGDSVIGQGCYLGAGTKIANLRLGRRTVQVRGRDTQRVNLGAIIGDGVRTGINASIEAGSIIGSNALIGPGATVSGVIDRGSRVF